MPESKLVTLAQLQMQAERIKAELNKYTLDSELETAVDNAITEAGASKMEVVEAIPEQETAQENVLYIYNNTGTGKYEIYALISGAVVRLDDDGGNVTDDMIATDEEVTSMLDEVFPQA